MKDIARHICPPVLWNGLRKLNNLYKKKLNHISHKYHPDGHQNLDVYWDPKMAESLETWGEGTVWNEIQYLLVNCSGKVLDIACGTGKTIHLLSKFQALQVYGCDISDFLINKAVERGIAKDHLMVGDATKMAYADNFFNYAYSIGSLEHFTEDGIIELLSECYRVTAITSFHMIPISRSGRNEGWITRYQSYYNNGVAWWLEKFMAIYQTVFVLDSQWEDDISIGKWFICIKQYS